MIDEAAGQRGFVLQSTYRIVHGGPVVLVYGRLEDGRSFVVRDTRQVPYFHVRLADRERARALGAVVRGESDAVDLLLREPVARVELAKPQDAPPLRDRLIAAGIPCFEADVRFAYRYLIDRGVRASIEIRGAARRGAGVDVEFENPDVGPADWSPALRPLSIDIETDPRARQLLSVGLAGPGVAEVLLLTPQGLSCPAGAIPFPTETELLRALVTRVRQIDPDVLTGWNFVDFDLAVLARIGERLGVALTLGRDNEPVRIRPAGGRGTSQATVTGRVVLDGIELLRGAFVKVESFGLDAVARKILGRGKTISGSGRAEKILEAFEHDRTQLVEYNLNDARLVLEIFDRLHLLELTVERSRLTGMPPDRVAASIASFDFLYLSELSRRKIVAPTVSFEGDSGVVSSGGHVLEPLPGLYRNILVFDFKSLYPSVIRTFQIDPLGLIRRETAEDDPIRAPNGALFRREPGILPRILDELFPRREAAKAAGDRVASQAIKILMNSFYGVLGTSACRFADPLLANAITGFGKQVLLWTKSRIERAGFEVLYGDTDSLFVRAGTGDEVAARAVGSRLVRELNRDLAEHVRATWRVDSRLELEFERLYLRLLLPVARHTAVGARKRYAGLVAGESGPEIIFTGMEVVRRDWTDLAKAVQRELYTRLFADRPVADYLSHVVDELRRGALDDQLVYRKGLRKSLADYTASTPPHVAAARKMQGRPGRVIRYVMTTDGPEPAAEVRSPIDHEHYVQRQVRPVAEPVLTLLGQEFDRVIGDDTQLRLF